MPHIQNVQPATSGTLSPRVEQLLARMQPARGRLIFALDATGSRQASWDMAAKLTAEMFTSAGSLGGLDIQLVYYRGFHECVASRWISSSHALTEIMTGIHCRAGETQIKRVLKHINDTHAREPVNAAVFIGDAVEEDPPMLYEATGRVPVFLFQEGEDPAVTKVFSTIAKLTGGAHAEFNAGSARRLGELLRAVSAFASGGLQGAGGGKKRSCDFTTTPDQTIGGLDADRSVSSA